LLLIDFRWNDRLPERRQELGHQRFEVEEGLQRGSHRRRDQSLAVHHPHEADLPHRLSRLVKSSFWAQESESTRPLEAWRFLICSRLVSSYIHLLFYVQYCSQVLGGLDQIITLLHCPWCRLTRQN